MTPQAGRWWRKAAEREEKNDKGDDGQTRLADRPTDRQCKVLMRAVQQLWAGGATGGNKWAENSKAHDKETATIVACSRLHHGASAARLFDFHNCIKEPVACASQGSYQPTAALTCPLQFNAAQKQRRTSLCLNCRINLHFKTSLPNCRFYFLFRLSFSSCMRAAPAARVSPEARFFFPFSFFHSPNGTSTISAVREYAAAKFLILCLWWFVAERCERERVEQPTCWRRATCHGRPRCFQDKASFAWERGG